MTEGTAVAPTLTGIVIVLDALMPRLDEVEQATAWPTVVQLHEPLLKLAGAVMPAGNVSFTEITPVVAAVPVLVTVSVYVAPDWPTAHGPFEVLAILSFADWIVVSTGGLAQSVAQAGSPPPLTCAVLCCVVPSIEACGVTLIVNVAVLFGATLDRPDATLHVTVWLLTVQVGLPGVVELMVKPVGTVSVTVAAALVAAVPLFVTVIVPVCIPSLPA